MSNINPYDELGRIFGSGGEQAVILERSSGTTGLALLAFISGKFPKLDDTQSAFLASFADQAVLAGEVIDSDTATESDIIDATPINSELYGVIPAGRRFRVMAQGTFTDVNTGKERKVNINADFGTVPTLEELLKEIETVLQGIVDDYERLREGLPTGELDDLIIDFIGAERRY